MENKITAIVTFIFFFLITFMGVIIMTPIVDAFAGQLPAEIWYGIGTISSIVLAGNMSIPFTPPRTAKRMNLFPPHKSSLKSLVPPKPARRASQRKLLLLPCVIRQRSLL